MRTKYLIKYRYVTFRVTKDKRNNGSEQYYYFRKSSKDWQRISQTRMIQSLKNAISRTETVKQTPLETIITLRLKFIV